MAWETATLSGAEISYNLPWMVTAASSRKSFSQRLAAALAIIVMAIVAMATTTGLASASATFTVDSWAEVQGRGEALVVHGTAACSTTSGTGTIFVRAQGFAPYPSDPASGFGGTTISCAQQPAYWSVTVPAFNCGIQEPDYCFEKSYGAMVTAFFGNNNTQEGVSQPVYTI